MRHRVILRLPHQVLLRYSILIHNKDMKDIVLQVHVVIQNNNHLFIPEVDILLLHLDIQDIVILHQLLDHLTDIRLIQVMQCIDMEDLLHIPDLLMALLQEHPQVMEVLHRRRRPPTSEVTHHTILSLLHILDTLTVLLLDMRLLPILDTLMSLLHHITHMDIHMVLRHHHLDFILLSMQHTMLQWEPEEEHLMEDS